MCLYGNINDHLDGANKTRATNDSAYLSMVHGSSLVA